MKSRRPSGGFPEPHDPFVRVYGRLHHHREPVDGRIIHELWRVLTGRMGRALGIIGVAVLVPLMLTRWCPGDEPRYQGRTLSAWTRILSRQADYQYPNPEPAEAIRAMGTNAVPHLSRMLIAKDSPRNIKVNEWLRSHEYWNRLAWRTADESRWDAMNALPYLDPASAQLLAPSLMRLRQDPDPEFQFFAWRCLSLVHLSPVLHERLFREALTNQRDGVRGLAMNELTPPNTPDVSVPILRQCLKDPAWNVRVGALTRLLHYQRSAAKAMALLTNFVNDPDSRMRPTVLSLLQPYQTNAAEAVAFFVPLLKDPDRHFASYAAGRLGKYGTNALPALPDMVAMLQTAPVWEQYAVGEAIFNLDHPFAKQVLTNGMWTYDRFAQREEQLAEHQQYMAGRKRQGNP